MATTHHLPATADSCQWGYFDASRAPLELTPRDFRQGSLQPEQATIDAVSLLS